MKNNFLKAVSALIITSVFTVTFTFAQNGLGQDKLGFFGNVSVKIYCAFSNFIPGSDNSSCKSNIVVTDEGNTGTTTENGTPTWTEAKIGQVNSAIKRTLNENPKVVYVQGPKGESGKNGTTTIIYQSTIPGAQQFSSSGYVYAGGNSNTNPYQTTVPADIFSTFVHHFQFEDAKGNNLSVGTIDASSTNTTNLTFGNATGTNLYSLFANLINLFSTNATITNATTTNLISTGNSYLANATIASSTQNNSSINSGNATLTTAVLGNSTTSNLFAAKASITEATTTYFFAAFANFMNLFVATLTFNNATGTNLQTENINTTNLNATGTSNLFIINSAALWASSTYATTSTAESLIVTNYANIGAENNSSVYIANSASSSAIIGGNGASYVNISSDYNSIEGSTGLNSNPWDTGYTLIGNGENYVSLGGGTNSIGGWTGTSTNFIQGNNYLFGTTSIFGETNVTNLNSFAATITTATTSNLYSDFFNALYSKIGFLEFNYASGTTLSVQDIFSSNLFANTANFIEATSSVLNAQTISNDTLYSQNLIFTSASNPFSGPIFNYDGSVLQLTAPGGVVLNTNNGDIITGFISSENASSTNLYTKNIATRDITNDGTHGLNIETISDDHIIFSTNGVERMRIRKGSNNNGEVVISSGLDVQGVATFTNATSTNLFAKNASITFATTTSLFTSLLNVVAATFTNLLTTNATITNATTTNLFATNINATGIIALATTTFTGNVLPSAAATYDLGSAAMPWRDLYVSSSTVHIGNASISNVNGSLSINGAPVAVSSSTATTSFGTVNSTKASITSATTTNLFASLFTSVTSVFDSLFVKNATLTNATSTNFVSTGLASLSNMFATSATTTNFNTSTLTGASSVITSATSTNLFSTNLRSTNFSATTVNMSYATVTAITAQSVINKGSTMNIGSLSSNLVNFLQNGTTVMTIHTTGEIDMTNFLGIGKSNPAYWLDVGSSTVPGIVARFTNSSGNCTINPIVGVSCSSDERLKKNIEETKFVAVDELNKVSVKEYNMLSQNEGEQKQVGFIAQNLETIFPWLVQTDSDGYKTVSYGNITPIIVQAIQEMKNKFFAEVIKTNKLCIGETCIDEQDLKDFKAYKVQIDELRNAKEDKHVVVVPPPATIVEPVASATEPTTDQ